MSEIEISLIIPTRNRATVLERLLYSVERQTLNKERFEIIIVDNGSTDNTKDIYEEFRDKFYNIDYCYCDIPGLHVGRNLGIQLSKSDILVYADDDIIANPNWLESILNSFRSHPEVMLVGGSNIPRYTGIVPDWVNDLWDRQEGVDILSVYSCLVFNGESRYITPWLVYGCNFAVRKIIVEQAGGFHPDGMPDELIKFRGDGESYISKYIEEHEYKAWYCDEAWVEHEVSESRLNLDYVRKIGYRSGVSYVYTMFRYNYYLKAIIVVLWKYKKMHKYSKSASENCNGVFAEGQAQGMKYLLPMYLKEKTLLEWVRKPNYYK